ncbi:ATP-binding cassette domain-containing protein [Crossiella sp. CA-258035]|uniref:ABC transporter ATP-binding protein n=1 Tax=Crossiella sp. CA-258035 TaxID=2981138 RepID=UPI0024BC9767|nr:ATP-binding cassette domain-containing protein [Crossiella sp. CA-258035]WHT22243.1 ATP-binding cassette domain-containing protein [Crossiella sp. CA-258035]
MIEFTRLTKRYRGATAVDGLTCTVRPGRVTGFLGPNGAGKSTTLRMLLGLSRPSSGSATVGGRRYPGLPDPLRRLGALLEATPAHPERTARQHLRALAQTHGLPDARVGQVLALAGLGPAADRRAGGFSLGMRQRLGIAGALLGDPAAVVLDEPSNGLDPDGMRWLRLLLRELAAQGRTVLVSSHLLSEMALTAQHLLVIGRGRLLADAPIAELTAANGSLEPAYLELTRDAVEFGAPR